MARSRRNTRQPETRSVVYDGYYGGFVPVENASFDVSTTPDAICRAALARRAGKCNETTPAASAALRRLPPAQKGRAALP